MLTLIGSAIGFIGSAIPQILGYFKQKADHKHELEMFRLQVDVMKLKGEIKLQEIEARADIAEGQVLHKRAEVTLTGSSFIDGIMSILNSSVRPLVTYIFCGFYGITKYAQFHIMSTSGFRWESITAIWNSADMALFCTIISFWFGSRAMRYALDRFSPLKEKVVK